MISLFCPSPMNSTKTILSRSYTVRRTRITFREFSYPKKKMCFPHLLKNWKLHMYIYAVFFKLSCDLSLRVFTYMICVYSLPICKWKLSNLSASDIRQPSYRILERILFQVFFRVSDQFKLPHMEHCPIKTEKLIHIKQLKVIIQSFLIRWFTFVSFYAFHIQLWFAWGCDTKLINRKVRSDSTHSTSNWTRDTCSLTRICYSNRSLFVLSSSWFTIITSHMVWICSSSKVVYKVCVC